MFHEQRGNSVTSENPAAKDRESQTKANLLRPPCRHNRACLRLVGGDV